MTGTLPPLDGRASSGHDAGVVGVATIPPRSAESAPRPAPDDLLGLLPPPTLAVEMAAELLAPAVPRHLPAFRLKEFRYDAAGFVKTFFNWRRPNGVVDEPAEYQLEILTRVSKPQSRECVRAPHGVGKTAIAAQAVLWFALTRDGLTDWKAITTASAWRHLEKFLWPEIHKWAAKLKWEQLGRPPFTKRELLELELHLRTGRAFAAASDKRENIEGAHADNLLYILDEAKTIPPGSWDAIEGAFSGAGSDTKAEAHIFAMSTPGVPSGRFYEIHARRPGFEDWHTRHITLEEATAASRVSDEWIQQRIIHYGGVDKVETQNRVFGNFAQDSITGVIPLAWAEQAVERWQPEMPHINKKPVPLTRISVDVARAGGDKTIMAARHGYWFDELVPVPGQDTVELANTIKQLLDYWGRRPEVVIDAIGIGAGAYDILVHEGYDVWGFIASEGTDLMDLAGINRFENKRAAAWWTLREALNPANGFNVALPPDDELIGDLTTPQWKQTSRGILIESKDLIRKRLGRSTDRGDAVAMSLAVREEAFEGVMIYEEPVVISQY